MHHCNVDQPNKKTHSLHPTIRRPSNQPWDFSRSMRRLQSKQPRCPSKVLGASPPPSDALAIAGRIANGTSHIAFMILFFKFLSFVILFSTSSISDLEFDPRPTEIKTVRAQLYIRLPWLFLTTLRSPFASSTDDVCVQADGSGDCLWINGDVCVNQNASPFSKMMYPSPMLARPARSDLTSDPTREIPHSNRSKI